MKLRRTFFRLVCSAAVIAAQAVQANDTIARVGTGGLIFQQSEDVRMVSEDLTISSARIDVRYRFRNEGDTPVVTTVAFPMPEFYWDPEQLPNWKNIGPVDTFTLEVDGQAVQSKADRKALLSGVDITAALRAAGLNEEQIFRTFGNAFDTEGVRVPEDVLARLTALKAVRGALPLWHVAETVYWSQTFPARQEISVKHSYRPFTGRSYSYLDKERLQDSAMIPFSTVDAVDRACLAEGGRAAVANRVRKHLDAGAKQVFVDLMDVEYVLGTGRNWKGRKIDDFKLNIVKETPDQIVSLCFPGKPVRIDARTLQFALKDYLPQDRIILNVYTVSPLANQ